MPHAEAGRVEPHQQRQVAESFGSDAQRYDRARPRYPEAMVRQVVAACPGLDVLDVGCGTGIAARQFLAAGCRVLGVDPDARMADLARRRGVEAEVAPFETWDPATRSSGVSTGTGPTPARSGWKSCLPSAVTARSRRLRCGNCWPA